MGSWRRCGQRHSISRLGTEDREINRWIYASQDQPVIPFGYLYPAESKRHTRYLYLVISVDQGEDEIRLQLDKPLGFARGRGGFLGRGRVDVFLLSNRCASQIVDCAMF